MTRNRRNSRKWPRNSRRLNNAMKKLLLSIALLLAIMPARAADLTYTASSAYDAARTDTTTGLVDYWQVYPQAQTVISVFGYNNGASQFLQMFDSTNAVPTVAVTAWNATADTFTAANSGLRTGQPIQVTTTTAGLSAAIYYVGMSNLSVSVFYLYDTKAHAISGAPTGGATGLQNLTGGSSTATLNLVPFHTLAIAAADNYWAIVPSTGISLGSGCLLAVSTTAVTYTAGAKDVTIMVTTRTQQ